jgi:hypothetical protein
VLVALRADGSVARSIRTRVAARLSTATRRAGRKPSRDRRSASRGGAIRLFLRQWRWFVGRAPLSAAALSLGACELLAIAGCLLLCLGLGRPRPLLANFALLFLAAHVLVRGLAALAAAGVVLRHTVTPLSSAPVRIGIVDAVATADGLPFRVVAARARRQRVDRAGVDRLAAVRAPVGPCRHVAAGWHWFRH